MSGSSAAVDLAPGSFLPGVDRIMRVAGLKPDYGRVDPAVLAQAALRGRYVHEACALVDEDDLDWDTLNPLWAGYVRAWTQFVADTGFVVVANEFNVTHPVLGYQGRPDVRGLLDSSPTMIDRKAISDETWRKARRLYGVQLAAYTMPGIQTEDGAPLEGPWRRLAVQLKSTGKYAKPHEYTNAEDYAAFRDALALYQAHAAMVPWRERYGLTNGGDEPAPNEAARADSRQPIERGVHDDAVAAFTEQIKREATKRGRRA